MDKDVSGVRIVSILEVEQKAAGFVTIWFSSLELAVEFFLHPKSTLDSPIVWFSLLTKLRLHLFKDLNEAAPQVISIRQPRTLDLIGSVLLLRLFFFLFSYH